MIRQNEDMAAAHIKELRRLLAVCVHRLGGHVVICSDDDDHQTREVSVKICPPGAVELSVKELSAK